ncbi:hypothetical protein [Nonomuraea sp. B5E05]|uniref:SCO4225 family membrane protein n=1 Tax=Nonomuraea sp. B5E05 TaxID=3153569 RepID=UPI0032600AA5
MEEATDENQGDGLIRRKYATLFAAAWIVFVVAALFDYARHGGHKGGMELAWSFLASFPLSLAMKWAWSAGLDSLVPDGLFGGDRVHAYAGLLTVTGLVQALLIWRIVRGKASRPLPAGGVPPYDWPSRFLTRVTVSYLAIVVTLTLLSLLTMPDRPTEPWVGGDHPDFWPLSFYAAFPTSMLLTSFTGLFTAAVDHRLLVAESFLAGLIQAVAFWMTLRCSQPGGGNHRLDDRPAHQ